MQLDTLKRGHASTFTAFIGALLLLATVSSAAHATASVAAMQVTPTGGAHVPEGTVVIKGECVVSTPNNTYDVYQDLRYSKNGALQGSIFIGSSVAPNTTNVPLSVQLSPVLTIGDYSNLYRVDTQIVAVEGGGDGRISFDARDDKTFHVDERVAGPGGGTGPGGPPLGG